MNTYGVSMGSTVSQQLLIDHPEKVRKAILSSATYSATIPETEKLHDILEDSSTNMDIPEEIRKEAVANLEYTGSLDGLPNITNDVMLITGTEDDLTPPSQSPLILQTRLTGPGLSGSRVYLMQDHPMHQWNMPK